MSGLKSEFQVAYQKGWEAGGGMGEEEGELTYRLHLAFLNTITHLSSLFYQVLIFTQ